MKSNINKKTAGFTLIEMLVAVFVFSVIMTLATGAIFSIISANKKSQEIKAAMDNLSSALDSMSRNIRYGTVYHCGAGADFVTPLSCLNGGTTFAFVDKDKNDVIYSFNDIDHSIEKSFNGSIYRLTAKEVIIDDLHFYVHGAASNELQQQPKVLITITGHVGSSQAKFNVETMVSQRALMCKDNMKSKNICQ